MFYYLKKEENKPSAPLRYPILSSISEQYINDKNLARKKIIKKLLKKHYKEY